MTTQSQSKFQIDESNLTISTSRVYNAPRELVYRVYFDPKYVSEWWGPDKYTTQIDQLEARPGGKWRFVQTGPEGDVHAFRGEFREIIPLERMVYTFEYEGAPGNIIVETVTFEDLGSQTRITVIDSFASLEELRGMMDSGMEEGANESYERLDVLLKRLQRGE